MGKVSWARFVSVIALLIILGIGCFGISMSVHQSSDFYDRCIEARGRVVYLGKGHELCMDAEGRILFSI